MDIKKIYDIVNLDKEKRPEFIFNLIKEVNQGENINYYSLAPVIIMDGMDGSGKGTYMDLTVKYLTSLGYNIIPVKEPSDFLRQEIYDSVNKKMNPWITATLFILDRKYQFNLLSKEKYGEKSILLFDRSYFSTLVYQTAQGISFDVLLGLHDFVPKHKLAFVFVCDPEIARNRILARTNSTGKEIIDEFEKLEFLRKEKEGYENIARHIDDTYLIDTTGNEEDILEIFEKIKGILDERINF